MMRTITLPFESLRINSAKGRLMLLLFSLASLCAMAAERTLLIGPKTIGRAWKDNILVEARQFADVAPGDLLCLYVADAKRTAQGAFQDPADWQGVAPEWGCFNIGGTIRMSVTQEILDKIQQRGMVIGGHDYRILRLTHIPASEVQEKVIYRGPSVRMADDWSQYANLQKSLFKNVKVGDGLRFHVSRVQPGACIKLTDMTYNPLERSVDGAAVGGDSFTYYIEEQSQLLRLSLAGPDGISVRVTGKGYTLNRISVVSITSEEDPDLSQAQLAPREYVLQPGEVFHGEKDFPQDWSGNLRLSAEAFQESNEGDCLIISYRKTATPAQMSFRENQGRWLDLSGSEEPVWYELDGTDLVYPLDAVALDKVKTRGLVITGVGFNLSRVALLSIE